MSSWVDPSYARSFEYEYNTKTEETDKDLEMNKNQFFIKGLLNWNENVDKGFNFSLRVSKIIHPYNLSIKHFLLIIL